MAKGETPDFRKQLRDMNRKLMRSLEKMDKVETKIDAARAKLDEVGQDVKGKPPTP